MNIVNRDRNAFTLVELLVVIAIIGILIGMALPAIQSLRESSRRAACSQNLSKISLGLSEYALVFTAYPAGSVNPTGPIENLPEGFHHNWAGVILPYIDYNAVYMAIDPAASIYADDNADAMANAVPTFQCPSASSVQKNTSCYAGLHHPVEAPIAEDNLGVFILNRQLTEDDFVDGLGATLMVSEKLEDYRPLLGWLSGTRASLRNAGHPIGEFSPYSAAGLPTGEIDPSYVGGLSSAHAGGVNALMGDGAIRFMANTTDMTFLKQLVDRRDGAIGTAEADNRVQ